MAYIVTVSATYSFKTVLSATSIQEAQKKVREFIKKYELRGSTYNDGSLYEVTNQDEVQKIGRISYNGNFFNNQDELVIEYRKEK